MNTLTETETRTVSALYRQEAAAERAIAGLREIGVPERQINVRRGREGGLAESGHGILAALGDFFMPENDRVSYKQGIDRGAVFVVATDLAPSMADEALDLLDREGIDLEGEWTSTGSDRKGGDRHRRRRRDGNGRVRPADGGAHRQPADRASGVEPGAPKRPRLQTFNNPVLVADIRL